MSKRNEAAVGAFIRGAVKLQRCPGKASISEGCSCAWGPTYWRLGGCLGEQSLSPQLSHPYLECFAMPVRWRAGPSFEHPWWGQFGGGSEINSHASSKDDYRPGELAGCPVSMGVSKLATLSPRWTHAWSHRVHSASLNCKLKEVPV